MEFVVTQTLGGCEITAMDQEVRAGLSRLIIWSLQSGVRLQTCKQMERKREFRNETDNTS
jgi:hypothetical protein